MVYRLDLRMENDKIQHYFLLVIYDFEKLASFLLSMKQNFILFAGKCSVERLK